MESIEDHFMFNTVNRRTKTYILFSFETDIINYKTNGFISIFFYSQDDIISSKYIFMKL